MSRSSRSPSSAPSASAAPRCSWIPPRTALLVDPALNGGLPPFLAAASGVESGMMIYQYTAAALVSEHKVLAHPATADSIPTSANQEDHVSMGSIAARHARTVLQGVERVIAIELLVAAQALE